MNNAPTKQEIRAAKKALKDVMQALNVKGACGVTQKHNIWMLTVRLNSNYKHIILPNMIENFPVEVQYIGNVKKLNK